MAMEASFTSTTGSWWQVGGLLFSRSVAVHAVLWMLSTYCVLPTAALMCTDGVVVLQP